MSANVETMFSVREVPWHGLGTIVQEAPTSEEAIRLAGLDWRVDQYPVYAHMDDYQIHVPQTFANIRSDNHASLGVVGNRYKIIQNADAFNFVDNLAEDGIVHYETAGALGSGERIWLLAKTENFKLLDDDVENYIVFTNSHDGKQSIKVADVPIRVVCQNTLNLALRNAKRTWRTTHAGNISAKMEEAKYTLNMVSKYTDALMAEAEKLVAQKVNKAKFDKFVEELFPLDKDESKRKATNIIEMRDELKVRLYSSPDLANFANTKWGVLNAVSDFVDHTVPQRNTDTFKEKNFARIVDGHDIFDRAYALLNVA